MKTTILLSLISTAVVAFSQPGWAGGGGFHAGGFAGGFRQRRSQAEFWSFKEIGESHQLSSGFGAGSLPGWV